MKYTQAIIDDDEKMEKFVELANLGYTKHQIAVAFRFNVDAFVSEYETTDYLEEIYIQATIDSDSKLLKATMNSATGGSAVACKLMTEHFNKIRIDKIKNQTLYGEAE